MKGFPTKQENEQIEVQLLLEAIYQKHGYDFRNYSRAHIMRRLSHRLKVSGFKTYLEMIEAVLYNPSYFDHLLADLSINVTEMFRDPGFYKLLREKVVPVLRTYPYLKIWHAGCASGEEVYSMAILLKEEGLFDRTQIYATDFNQNVLQRAKDGIYASKFMKEYERNYEDAGGGKSLNDYFTTKYDSSIVDQSLKKNIVFSDHNLVLDGVFGEMNLIMCRNVLIYFDKQLQNRVVKLFLDSLSNGGTLCLGSKESLKFTHYANFFETFDEKQRIYRKNYQA
jgi:chemotaxis protein methyltransferase CheR